MKRSFEQLLNRITRPVVLIPSSLVLLLILTIAKLPAQHLVARFEHPLISLGTATGTLWNGKVSYASVNGVRFEQLNWRLSASALLTGRMSIQINTPERQQNRLRSRVKSSLFNIDKVSVESGFLSLPANVLSAQFPLPLPVKLFGRVEMTVEEFVFQRRCKRLNATGRWIDGEVLGMDGEISFGTFNSVLSCKEGNLRLQVTPDNPLQLSTIATITDFGGLSASGTFVVPENMPAEVAQAANLFATKNAQGAFEFEL